MRPQRIRVEGFSAYRAPVEVDLEGVEFFSLSGATGSGKSSLVDAMVFALYGRVPRLGARAVEPVISAGSDQARVAFDFEVGGAGYTAVRLAQRTKGGATVKEARLQKAEKVIADGASDVTTAVEELLRLRFEDFTRTVVLPQGDFARFLTADKAERQALLRNLLGLEVYSTMRSLARTRESVAVDRTEVARARLAGLEIPDEGVFAGAKQRLEDLERVAEEIVDQERNLAELAAASDTSTKRVALVEGQLDRLGEITPPDRFEELEMLAAAASDAVETSDDAVEKIGAEVNRIEESIASLPGPELMRGLVDAHGRLAELNGRLEGLDLAGATRQVESTQTSLRQARTTAEGAREALEREKASHAAHALTLTLDVGDACPVCDQVVPSVPDRKPLPGLMDLEEADAAAAAALEAATEVAGSAKSDLAAVQTARAEVEAQVKALSVELTDAPTLDELAEMEVSHRNLVDQLASARIELETAKAENRRARNELDEFSESIRSVQRDLMAARQSVADLEPPIPASDDPIVQWKEFGDWREVESARLNQVHGDLVIDAEVARAGVDEFRSTIIDRLGAVGVEAEEPYAVGVTRELQVVRAFVAGADKALSEKSDLSSQIEASSLEAAVAGSLARHLRADGFEQWLMAGAIADLVAGANGRLEQLSGGGYSLHSDETGGFSIIDHHNAGEIRSVATLSGGETFLVSLALALSLAETLAARGGADLDAIVIDEGFGTLDDDSLDTVASVLEDLAGNLMVGVITHVKELADRAPSRYEVTREPGGSTVKQVSA